jgi:hypothetical protein
MGGKGVRRKGSEEGRAGRGEGKGVRRGEKGRGVRMLVERESR